MEDLVLRFFIGGTVVGLFAVLGDMIRPKSFAGLFGAAPSVALATLGLAVHQHGKPYTSYEARSMIFGALAFLLYAVAVSWFLRRYRQGALFSTMLMMPIWLGAALGLWSLIGRRF